MTETNHPGLSKRIKLLETEIANAKAKQEDLQRQLERTKKREEIALNGYRLERDKRLKAEKALAAHNRPRAAPIHALLEAIIARIPDQMIIFTYHDGIYPKQMKFVWFKHAHPVFLFLQY